jgi:CheY-like chemotaxis protein
LAHDSKVHVVQSGEEALSFLYHGVEFTDAPRPDVVLLDLNLPEMTGFDVLAAIKQHEHLQDVPVIVLTGSTAEEDIRQAYELRASCYLTKPRAPEGYTELIETIDKLSDA